MVTEHLEDKVYSSHPQLESNLVLNTLHRFTLNLKRLPYKTIFIEFADIARISQEIGASPTGTWPDGSPKYTVPVIYDPSTKTAVAESTTIARYLDKTYPDTPRAFPEGTEAFHEVLQVALRTAIDTRPFGYIVKPLVPPLLSPDSAAHYEVLNQSFMDESLLEKLSVRGSSAREEYLVAVENEMGKIAKWIEVDGKERKFFMGDTPSYADFLIGAPLENMKKVLGDESDEWRRIEGWHGGRWGRLLESLEALSN